MRRATLKALAAITVFASILGNAPAAQARSAKNYKVKCGYVTCSLYVSRSQTKKIAEYVDRNSDTIQGGGATLVGGACLPLGPWAALACGGIGVNRIAQFSDTVKGAGSQGNCLRMRFTLGGMYLNSYNDGGKNCFG